MSDSAPEGVRSPDAVVAPDPTTPPEVAASPGGVVALCGALGLAAVTLPLRVFVRTGSHVAADPTAAGPWRS